MQPPRTAQELNAVFGEDDLATWQTIFEANIPDPPTPAECMTAPQVLSLELMSRKLGPIIRMKLHNGDTTTIALNPVVAKYLADALLESGELHAWMNADHKLTFPMGGD